MRGPLKELHNLRSTHTCAHTHVRTRILQNTSTHAYRTVVHTIHATHTHSRNTHIIQDHRHSCTTRTHVHAHTHTRTHACTHFRTHVLITYIHTPREDEGLKEIIITYTHTSIHAHMHTLLLQYVIMISQHTCHTCTYI